MIKPYAAFLVLENSQVYQGWSFCGTSVSCGEIVFNTGMTGYQEVVTDPSYCDQIVLFTYPEIGNTGINMIDVESNDLHIKGLVLKSICLHPSNWRAKMSFPEYLMKKQIPHIFGLDTRSLTKHLRSQGVMIACIAVNSYDYALISSSIVNFRLNQSGSHLVDQVTTRKVYKWPPEILHGIYYQDSDNLTGKKLHVVVVDYGVKFNILNRLVSYGCNLTVVPADTSYRIIAMYKPDGVMLSNGPGDPSIIDHVIDNIKKMLELNIPVFGICLGHQLLSLAFGASTAKLKFGHRGLNHPSGLYNLVKMTSQNHGYVVSANTISEHTLAVACLNLNDRTISALVHKNNPFFSVQYHPEASPGPRDSDYLFAHFVNVMLCCKKAIR